MTGISQLKAQWEREAREDERKLIADRLKNWAMNIAVNTPGNSWAKAKEISAALNEEAEIIRNGSYRNKP